jgi:ribosome biogenesis protein BMS1
VVQGSKQSGKSSLIRSLIKHYTKYKVDEINGTITLRANKKQRITIIECPNEICAMIDLAKIADLVVLVIDASLGFEMETFEFLSLMKSHGFPNVCGALTHLDFFKENKQLKKTKKKFKKRFEYEVGGNHKLFNLGKFDNGLYEKIETAKIARHLGSCKAPEIPWRLNHPFIVADRWQTYEDKGYSKDDNVDISFYGYVRGSSYRINGKVHVVGVGDFLIKEIKAIADPCPEYKKDDKKEEEQMKTKGDVEDENMEDGEDEQNEGNEQKPSTTPIKRKRRTLNQQ